MSFLILDTYKKCFTEKEKDNLDPTFRKYLDRHLPLYHKYKEQVFGRLDAENAEDEETEMKPEKGPN